MKEIYLIVFAVTWHYGYVFQNKSKDIHETTHIFWIFFIFYAELTEIDVASNFETIFPTNPLSPFLNLLLSGGHWLGH